MKKVITAITGLIIPLVLSAQMTFESGNPNSGAWKVFSNGTGDSLVKIVSNPTKDDVNSSDSVLRFVSATDGDLWAGFYTDSIVPYVFNDTNAVIKLLVYKTVISDFDLKLEVSSSDFNELKVANVGTNAWEILSFDFTAQINNGKTYTRLTLIPDFPAATRSAANTSYIDNIDNFKIKGDTVVTSIDAIKGVSGSGTLIVSPSPSSDFINLKGYSGEMDYLILNSIGQTVRSGYQKENAPISVRGLKSGVYVVKINSKGANYVAKFIIR
jgi:Secretion system C-terminal sorting domain